MKCFQEQGKPDDTVYPAELQDNGLYWLRCRANHETVTCLQEQKFEVLYDLAANAILDAYYREAVVTFTSSLERFYEFYIHVMSVKRSINEQHFRDAWKRVSSQSERQYGAYVFLYTIENGAPPPSLSNNQVNFRNDVVHKGKIPSNEESVSYGEAVLEVIEPVLTALKNNESKHVSEVVGRYVQRMHEQIQGKPHISFMSAPTTISISRAVTEPNPKLKETLSRLSQRRRRGGW